ncbi:hypothetical protein HNV12_12675 [Methanococcoides sp. SA1]|nr:hypothetical protein [Methanococcoides sp. SA1]
MNGKDSELARLFNNKKTLLIIVALSIILAISIFTSIFAMGPGLPSAERMPNWYMVNSDTHRPLFPLISINSESNIYSDSLVMIVWYFETESEFQRGEKKLSEYIEDRGQIEDVELYIRGGINTALNATKYEENETSGFFIVYEKPFGDNRDDYFITYYGTTTPELFSEQEDEIISLITHSYYSSSENVTGLDELNWK